MSSTAFCRRSRDSARHHQLLPPRLDETGLRQKDDGDLVASGSRRKPKNIAPGSIHPQRRRGTGLRSKDDGGINPRRARNVTAVKGRWGGADDLVAGDIDIDREKI